MQLDKVSLADTRAFSNFFLDYLHQKETLKPFYNRFPTLENFGGQIADKKSSFTTHQRDTLVAALQKQYEGFTLSPAVSENITKLKSANTFTVTTGHQLNVFTGPLYFIFKIVTVINTCRQLKARHPESDFVPVYWMASEDHDYEEIKSFRLFGKKYVWETQQQGAVGRFNTKGLDKIAQDISGDFKVFTEAYSKRKTLSAAVRHYVNALFASEGLVVIDGDDRALKSLFAEPMREDVLRQNTKKLVDVTNAALEDAGYKTQIFCRDINFFYLADGIRSRIEKHGDRFTVLESDLSFSEQEMKNIIDNEPEKLSPNVILRPLYQEMILPNVAYVGGPAEVIYWLQLKAVFDHFKTPFPMIMPRNFGMVMDHEVARKFSKTSLELKDLFEEKNYLFNHWVLTHSTRNLTVGQERTAVNELFTALRSRAESIDKTLEPFVGAEGKRALNSLEKIERKLLRAEKRQHSDRLRQIEAVKDVLFPNGSLQERTDNFLNFYLRDPEFITRLLDSFDPFDYAFNVLSYVE